MKIVFRVNINTSDEILMGHKLWFSDINGVEAISATASADGFTPLTALARTYGWNRDLIDIAAAQCNLRRPPHTIPAKRLGRMDRCSTGLV